MTTLNVGSFVRYLTETDGLQWRSADYRARIIVKSIKGHTFDGYSKFKIGGKVKRIDATNAETLVPIILNIIARAHLKEHANFPHVVVPIPNSNMAVGSSGPFRIQEHAEWLANETPDCTGCCPALRWMEPKEPSHNQSGFRSPDNYEGMLTLVEKPVLPVVLFDDVLTSGSQMIAGARVLRKNGIDVRFGVTVGRSVKVQVKKPIEWELTSLEIDPQPFDLSAILQN